jgi:hypothetical protein
MNGGLQVVGHRGWLSAGRKQGRARTMLERLQPFPRLCNYG